MSAEPATVAGTGADAVAAVMYGIAAAPAAVGVADDVPVVAAAAAAVAPPVTGAGAAVAVVPAVGADVVLDMTVAAAALVAAAAAAAAAAPAIWIPRPGRGPEGRFPPEPPPRDLAREDLYRAQGAARFRHATHTKKHTHSHYTHGTEVKPPDQPPCEKGEERQRREGKGRRSRMIPGIRSGILRVGARGAGLLCWDPCHLFSVGKWVRSVHPLRRREREAFRLKRQTVESLTFRTGGWGKVIPHHC